MEAKLRIIAGPYPGETIQVSSGKLLVGRAPDCDLHARSEFASGHHCIFMMDEHTLRIRDLGSKNGTLVNGRRIGTTPVILLHDDIVTIGDVYFLVDLRSAIVTEPLVTENVPPVPPAANQGTEVFNGDTVQRKLPGNIQPLSEPAPSPPSVPAVTDPDSAPPPPAPNP